jgi:predicted Zn-dependent peptidase
MPNIKILGKFDRSQILEAIEAANQMKIERSTCKNGGQVVVAPMKTVDTVVV